MHRAGLDTNLRKNIAQNSHAVGQRQPASIVHIMTIHSAPPKGQLALTVIIIMAPLSGTWRRHCSLFFFSHNEASFFLFGEVPSMRCSQSLNQPSEKGFYPIKSTETWRVPHTRPSCVQEKGRVPMCSLGTKAGVNRRLWVCPSAFGSRGFEKHKGQRLNVPSN